MANQIIKGRDLMLFDSDGHATAYATNHTLTINAEVVSIASKDHGVWGASDVGQYTWEITTENLYTEEQYDDLFDKMLAGDPITIRFGLKSQTDSSTSLCPADGNTSLPYWTSDDTYYEGKVIITSLTANANNGEVATLSATFTGTGSIGKAAAA